VTGPAFHATATGRAGARAVLLFAVSAVFAVFTSRASAQDSASAPAVKANTPLDRAAARYRDAKSLRATFNQTLTSPTSKTVRAAAGEYMQRSAGIFAIRYTDPKGDAIISDGQVLWLYLPSSMKNSVMKMPGAAGSGMNFLAQLLSSPRVNYVVGAAPDTTFGGRTHAVYSLTPKKGTVPFVRATLWIGKRDALLWMLETVEPSGMIRRVRFTSIRPNATVPKSATTFVVPDGVKIVDQAALLGGKP
jgi:chaperone LolA